MMHISITEWQAAKKIDALQKKIVTLFVSLFPWK
jgi:hypothetical protein